MQSVFTTLSFSCAPCSIFKPLSHNDKDVIELRNTLEGCCCWCGVPGYVARVGRSLFLGVCLLWQIFRTHPYYYKEYKKKILPSSLYSCFVIFFPIAASLIEVMCIFSSSRLLVCDACCGLSVGAFKSASPTAVEPQNKRVWRWAAQQALGASAASASNWGKICGTWSLLVGSGRGGVTPPHFPLLLWCHWWSTADSNPLISTLGSPRLTDYVSWDIHTPTGFDFHTVLVWVRAF